MLLTITRERKFLFVGGKGGNGKTSVSSALAMARANDGGRVLLVSTDPAHSLGYLWDQRLSDTATRVFRGSEGHIDALEINPATTIKRHFEAVQSTMLRMLPERLHTPATQHLDLARTAPGSHESAVLERIAEVIEQAGDYDLVIFDTAPSGHTLQLLALPERLTSWTETLLASRKRSETFAAAARGIIGTNDEVSATAAQLRRVLLARRKRFALMSQVITDPSATAFLIVTLAENLSVAETLDLAAQLKALKIPVGAAIVNRRSPTDAGPFLASQHAREDAHVQRLTAKLGSVPIHELPLVARDLTGADAIGELAGHL